MDEKFKESITEIANQMRHQSKYILFASSLSVILIGSLIGDLADIEILDIKLGFVWGSVIILAVIYYLFYMGGDSLKVICNIIFNELYNENRYPGIIDFDNMDYRKRSKYEDIKKTSLLSYLYIETALVNPFCFFRYSSHSRYILILFISLLPIISTGIVLGISVMYILTDVYILKDKLLLLSVSYYDLLWFTLIWIAIVSLGLSTFGRYGFYLMVITEELKIRDHDNKYFYGTDIRRNIFLYSSAGLLLHLFLVIFLVYVALFAALSK